MGTLPPRAGDWRRGISRETARGRLVLWLTEPLLILQVVGHGDKSFFEPIQLGFQRCLEQCPSVQLFVDMELMPSYDSELRTEGTAMLRAQRERVQELHIVVGSKLVAMGVSVANLALGGLMTVYDDPACFMAELDAATVEAGVLGFSMRAFAQERRRSQGGTASGSWPLVQPLASRSSSARPTPGPRPHRARSR